MGAFEKMGRFVSSKRSCIKNRLVAAQVSAKKDVEAAVSWPQYVPLPQYVSSGSLSLIVSSTLTVHLQEDKKSQSQFLFFQSPIKVLSKGSAGVNINKLQPPQNLQSPRRTCPLSHDTSIGQVTARRQLNRPHWWQRLRRRTNKMAKMWRILLVTNRG